MIFERENLSFNILDVCELKQNDINMFNSGRNFDALSFRFRADTVLKTEKNAYTFKDNSVCYAPAMLDYTRISNYDELIVVHFNSTNYFSKTIEFLQPQSPEKLGRLFKDILKIWGKKETGYKHACSALLYEIFALLYKETYTEKSGSKIINSVKYITENYTNPDITVSAAAEKSNISEVYFRKIFKDEFGVSPKKYIINSRIRLAVNLIESGYYTLGEIASLCGFTDYKYFSTEFRRIMGEPPSKYYYNYNKK